MRSTFPPRSKDREGRAPTARPTCRPHAAEKAKIVREGAVSGWAGNRGRQAGGVLDGPGRGPQEGRRSRSGQDIVPGALPVHRLDRDTSGVVLFGLTRDATGAERGVDRGGPRRPTLRSSGGSGVAARCGCRSWKGRRAPCASRRGDARAQAARTDLRRGAVRRLTWCSCRPFTGRTHQIRGTSRPGSSAADRPRATGPGPVPEDLHPGCADPDAVALARTPLHATRSGCYPSGRGSSRFKRRLPEDLAAALDFLRARGAKGQPVFFRAPASFTSALKATLILSPRSSCTSPSRRPCARALSAGPLLTE